jgi:mRNA interferase HigB
MRVIAKKILRNFWTRYPKSKVSLQEWYAETEAAKWDTTNCIKLRYRSASFLKDNRVVFNIGGNKFRLIVKINYAYGVVYIRFIGTHNDYDLVNAEII